MSEQTSKTERREVHFSGRVQGVGFRYTTRDIAARFAVTGFVQNLPDGRVLLIAEGTRKELDAFIAAVSAEMARHISNSDQAAQPATGEFASFSIRH